MPRYPTPTIAVAPMMDWTDRHCRVFHRRLSASARLYTEMVTAEAVLHGDRERLIGFDPAEHPVALQLGGHDPARLAEAAAIGAAFGYDEINLNVGCPSDRVQGGRFGACLMAEPGTVAACVNAMKAAVSVPVTVKCRIGIDDQDSETGLDRFADAVFAAGCDALWVHARKAWLKGLSPAQNRDVPPLDYDRVFRLKARLADAFVGINGGIGDLDQAERMLVAVDGVMLGRAAYQRPALLAEVDRRFAGAAAWGSTGTATAPGSNGTGARPGANTDDLIGVAAAMIPYVAKVVAEGMRPHAVTRHMLGLFHGNPGARAWRRHLTVGGVRPGATEAVLEEALAAIAACRRDPRPVPASHQIAAA